MQNTDVSCFSRNPLPLLFDRLLAEEEDFPLFFDNTSNLAVATLGFALWFSLVVQDDADLRFASVLFILSFFSSLADIDIDDSSLTRALAYSNRCF